MRNGSDRSTVQPLQSAYLRFCDGLAAVVRVVVMTLMATMTVDCVLGVFFRYVVQDALTWTEETARYVMIWMGFKAKLASRDGVQFYDVDKRPFQQRMAPVYREFEAKVGKDLIDAILQSN